MSVIAKTGILRRPEPELIDCCVSVTSKQALTWFQPVVLCWSHLIKSQMRWNEHKAVDYKLMLLR